MAYILNETPTGAINGVNTTYTTAQSLYQAVTITVDGVIYTAGVSFLNNTFTLDDAPTVSVTISYYTSSTSTPVSGTLLVSTVKSAFERYKKDISDVSNATFLDWADWVNKFAYRYILGIDPERYIEETVINQPAGDTFAYLPSDFRDIQRFGCGLYLIGENGEKQPVSQPMLNPNANITGFYIKNDKIYFTGNSQSDNTFQLRYSPNEPEIDALTDTFTPPLDSRYMQYLVYALDVMYDQWDEDVPMEGIADQRFSRLLDELARNIRQEPAIYNFEDSSLMY
ncbi:hypothetical protein KBA63_00050 [Candidatus Woesebacteria bacterium]|nr:hypothetical protein [Candidatus Woesebacteria bacterium]